MSTFPHVESLRLLSLDGDGIIVNIYCLKVKELLRYKFESPRYFEFKSNLDTFSLVSRRTKMA